MPSRIVVSPASASPGPIPAASTSRAGSTRRRAVWLAALLVAALATGMFVPPAWQATELREAYLPQLAAMAQRDGTNGPRFALLGGRQIQAEELAAAGDSLVRAVSDGEKSEQVWLCLSASKAAINDPSALAYLHVAAMNSSSPGIMQAQARVALLEPSAHGIALARAICPQGPQPLIDTYTRGSFFNGLVAWWGRHHPNQSGFATREEWARQEPNNPQAQRLWGLALLENERFSEASTVLGRAAALAPQSPDVLLALGELAEDEGQPGQASVQYVACLRARPDWLPALLGLGRCLLAAHLPITAGQVFREAARKDPNSAAAWIGEGQVGVMTLKGMGYTLDAYTHAIRLAPHRTDFYSYYAVALRQNGHWQEAQTILGRRLAVAPGDSFSHFLLGETLSEDAPTPVSLSEALAETQTSLALAPGNLPCEQQMANILLTQGQTRQAVSWLKQVLALDPSNIAALSSLARAEQTLGQTASAQATAEKAAALSLAADQAATLKYQLAMNPGNLELHQKIVRAYARSGQEDKARQEQQFAAYLQAHPEMHGRGPETLQDLVDAALPSQQR